MEKQPIQSKKISVLEIAIAKNSNFGTNNIQNRATVKYFLFLFLTILSFLSTDVIAQTTYLWSTGATTPTLNASPTVTTTYYVTITHNGVDYLDSITIVVNQPNSSEVDVTAPSSYTWDANGQTYTTSGTYTATFQNTAGCDSTATLNLTIFEPLQYDLTQSATLVCEGEEVVLGVSFGPQYPAGYVHCNSSNQTQVVEVTNPVTGKIWMDRNIGANRAATSSTDAESFGSLFQWGRGADGHQCVNRYAGDGATTSGNTALNATSATDTPPHDDFILRNAGNFDWRSTTNNSLWQGESGINNPCPSGYRLPTYTELTQEVATWSPNNAAGAFAAPLKFSLAGRRVNSTGALTGVDTEVYFWSSTISGTSAARIRISTTSVAEGTSGRSHGYSVRCIKD